ncbi:S8 family peptidase [Anaerocolumna aminovalerica]|uniref:S8 family peptidase n=1 Tax=Anaerocolumna aminovalerica TaxID=1527 RepID=UPI001C0F030F|nr:S8 family peptidase [Anaerocolumna aminovalerica]MBU5331966.1 S8 family peptidase [Anaerocolumna aminovalerica]
MTDNERFKITSNDYADLIIDNDQPLVMDIPYSINRINNQYSTIFIPVSYMTYNSVYKFSYEAIPKCYGLLSSGKMEMEKNTTLNTLQANTLHGEGVLIGMIDTGIDYTNPLFKNENNSSRIVTIWDQTIETGRYPAGLFYGTEYRREEINDALLSEDPFSVVPSVDEIGHGTMLAGIAGGYDPSNPDFTGIATLAEFAVVKLKPAKPYLKEFFCIPESAICYQENDIMMAVTFLQQVAINLRRPMVICLGIGTSQGPHMGLDILSNYLMEVNETIGYSVVVGAGNEGNSEHHFFGSVDPDVGYQIVELNVAPNEYGFSMELWGDSPSIFGAEIIAPDGTFIARIPATILKQDTIRLEYGETVIFVDNEVRVPRIGDSFLLFRFRNPQQGIWQLHVFEEGFLNMHYHIWLPMEKFISVETYFILPNPFTTLSAPANAEWVFAVTAYNPVDLSIYTVSSRGFTKVDLIKPNVSAPGQNIYAPSVAGTFINASGTGIAAAYAAGTVAQLLEWGIIRGNHLTMNGIDVNRLLIRGAYRDPNLIYPNQEWGYGILNLEGALETAVLAVPVQRY